MGARQQASECEIDIVAYQLCKLDDRSRKSGILDGIGSSALIEAERQEASNQRLIGRRWSRRHVCLLRRERRRVSLSEYLLADIEAEKKPHPLDLQIQMDPVLWMWW